MAFEGRPGVPKADKVAGRPTAQAVTPNPPDRLHILRPSGRRRWLGLAPQKPVSLMGDGGGGGSRVGDLRRAATCRRASVCESFLSHALSVCSISGQCFPFVPMCCIFGPGGASGREGSQRTREASTLCGAQLRSVPPKHILMQFPFFFLACGFMAFGN